MINSSCHLPISTSLWFNLNRGDVFKSSVNSIIYVNQDLLLFYSLDDVSSIDYFMHICLGEVDLLRYPNLKTNANISVYYLCQLQQKTTFTIFHIILKSGLLPFYLEFFEGCLLSWAYLTLLGSKMNQK